MYCVFSNSLDQQEKTKRKIGIERSNIQKKGRIHYLISISTGLLLPSSTSWIDILSLLSVVVVVGTDSNSVTMGASSLCVFTVGFVPVIAETKREFVLATDDRSVTRTTGGKLIRSIVD